MTCLWQPNAQPSADTGAAPRAWIAAAALLATCLSCTQGSGETAQSCRAESDADGDGLAGCLDPDCHRFELCRPAHALRPDDGGAEPPAGGTGGSAGVAPTGGTGGPPMSGDASVLEPDDDGGTEPDANPCACAADEVCLDVGCVSIEPPPPPYTVQLVSAQSPRGTPGFPPDGLCVEVACRRNAEIVGGSFVSYCPCEPEPYVRVVHIAPAAVETVVHTTKVVGTALSVTFDASERVALELQPGDALRFELWDDNVTTADSMIYACEPDLGDLSPGSIDCSVLSGTFGTERFWIRATLARN